MDAPLRIVVSGLAATYPLGGVFWDYLQYVLGFHRLGHEVLYLEDTGRWCYDPAAETYTEDGEANARLLAKHLGELEPALAERWFYRDALETTYGCSWPEVVDFCRTADLFLNISASCWMREEYFAAGKTVFVDTDPMYTQVLVPDYVAGTLGSEVRERIDRIRHHDVFFTFGENIGAADCRVPAEVFDWIPTRQPIVLDCFTAQRVPVASRRRVLTTVASWEPREQGPKIDGVQYWGKSREFERFINIPSQSPLPLEVALSGAAPLDRLRRSGWAIIPGRDVSDDPWTYRDYMARSSGEWSVAKNAYVAGRTGWFSCRTACYLALGVPAVVQQTGFERSLPTGEGLFAFSTMEDAIAAIEAICRDPQRQSERAYEIAAEYFDSNRILSELIEKAAKS